MLGYIIYNLFLIYLHIVIFQFSLVMLIVVGVLVIHMIQVNGHQENFIGGIKKLAQFLKN